MMVTYIIHLCSHNKHEHKLILSDLGIHTWIVCRSVDVNREREEVITKSVPSVNQSHAHKAFSVSVCLVSRLAERLECRLSISLGWIVTLSFLALMACLMLLFNGSPRGSAIYHLPLYSKGRV